MNIQLQQAFEGAYKLPLFEQNILAEALMATIRNYELFADDEKQWDKLFQSEASQQWLEKMATQVEEEINQGEVFDFDPATYVSQK
jgi:L-rhamnose mutarotase